MHYAGKLNLRSHNSSYCLIKVVIKAGLTACIKYHTNVVLKTRDLLDCKCSVYSSRLLYNTKTIGEQFNFSISIIVQF